MHKLSDWGWKIEGVIGDFDKTFERLETRKILEPIEFTRGKKVLIQRKRNLMRIFSYWNNLCQMIFTRELVDLF